MDDRRRTMSRKHAGWLWLAALLWVGLGVVPAWAQETESWTPPVPLSQSLTDASGLELQSSFPTLVADPTGAVHAFWTLVPREGDDGVRAIFYARWDGELWSAPLDVKASSGRPMWYPQVTIDRTDRLHLVWLDGYDGAVWYSAVAAAEADSVRAWSASQQLEATASTSVSVAAGPDGQVYVVYCTGKEEDRVLLASSPDGWRWTDPIVVYRGCDDCLARVAVDGRGRLHVVFGGQGLGGAGVYYSRSDDGGQTWRLPLELDRVDERYAEPYGPALGNVLAIGNEEIHIVWDGAPAGQRWHQWSTDGGDSWSRAEVICTDHRGLTLPVAMAADAAGTLHLVSMGWRELPDRPAGPFHFTWRSGRWSAPALVGSRADWDAEYAALAVSLGNTLVAAWTEKVPASASPTGKEGLRIWASTLAAGARAASPRPLATSTPPGIVASPAAAPDDGETPTASPSVVAPAPLVGGLGMGQAGPSWRAILAGVLPPLVLVAVVMLIYLNRLRRR